MLSLKTLKVVKLDSHRKFNEAWPCKIYSTIYELQRLQNRLSMSAL